MDLDGCRADTVLKSYEKLSKETVSQSICAKGQRLAHNFMEIYSPCHRSGLTRTMSSPRLFSCPNQSARVDSAEINVKVAARK